MLEGWFDDFRAYLAKPFSADMPATHWFLFLGMLIIFIIAWNIILAQLFGAMRD